MVDLNDEQCSLNILYNNEMEFRGSKVNDVFLFAFLKFLQFVRYRTFRTETNKTIRQTF